MKRSEDLNGNNTSQSEIDDGVMLDSDQPLHHTPVLVSMPTPSASMPEPNSLSMPPAMVLPPSNGNGSLINTQNHFQGASFSGRSLLRPVHEAQDQASLQPASFRDMSTSFRTTTSVLSSDSEAEPSTEFFMNDSSERFMEEASMEASLADDANKSNVVNKKTLISPSGPMGRRRINGSIKDSEKIVVSQGPMPVSGREASESTKSHSSSINGSESFTSGSMPLSEERVSSGAIDESKLDEEVGTSGQGSSQVYERNSRAKHDNPPTAESLDSSMTHVASKIEQNEPIRSRPDSTGGILGWKRPTAGTSMADDLVFPICSDPQQLWEIFCNIGVASSDTRAKPTTYVDILHFVFTGLTYPELSIDHIQSLWDSETKKRQSQKELTIPEQIMLQASSDIRPLMLLLKDVAVSGTEFRMPSSAKLSVEPETETAKVPLFWSLPTAFSKVFLQLLCRLINAESRRDFELRLLGSEKKRRHPRFMSPPNHESPKPDIIYTIARLSNSKVFEEEISKGEQSILPRIMSLVEQALEKLAHQAGKHQNQKEAYSKHQKHYADVLPSLIYLMGIWGAGGISPFVLRRWLSLIATNRTDNLAATKTSPVVYRDGLVRALTFATRHGSIAIPPRSFFCFRPNKTASPGLKRAIKGLPHWPFRNDFGFATWFRCEHAHHSVQLLSVRTDRGAGWTISLNPLAGSGAYSLVVSVFDNGDTAPSNQLGISGCVLVPKNWYHIAIRHTRSRLKGVFSLSTRQHLVLLLDGKVMTNEPLSFPKVEQGGLNETTSLLLSRSSSSQAQSRLNLEIEAAANFEGEMGQIYIFKDSVADVAFRSLYEATGGIYHRKMQRPDSHNSALTSTSWDARHADIVKKSRVLDHSIKNDDADEIVLSSGNGAKHKSRFSQNDNSGRRPISVIDFDEPENDTDPANMHQELASFESKIFIVWDPHRSMDSLAFELHVGAHVILDKDVHVWKSCSPQDAISSIGGVQALIPLFRSMIAVGGGAATGDDLSILANLFLLLAAFVQGHAENARELLRCGGIDVIEQLLLASKKVVLKSSSSLSSSTRSSLFAMLSANEYMATELVESLLVLRSSSQHYVGLETKVFARLLFNLPLWFGQNTNTSGAALHLTLLPALSFLTKTNPAKVRECIGAKDMIYLLREMMTTPSEKGDPQKNRFLGDSPTDDGDGSDTDFISIFAEPLAPREKRHVRRIILGMIFQVFSGGVTPRDLGPLIRLISMNTEEESSSTKSELSSLRHLMQLELCTILLFLLQLSPPVPGLFESLAQCCGSVQSVVGWLMAVMAKSADERMIGLSIRSVFAYILVVSKNEDQPLSQTAVTNNDDVDTSAAEVASTTVALASSTVASLAKGIASSMGPAGRTMVFSPSKFTPRVVYKLLWHLLKARRSVLGEDVRNALIYCMSDARESLAGTMLLTDHLLEKLVIHAENAETSGCWFSYDVAMSMLQKSGNIVGRSLQNTIVIATVLRLLAFLPSEITRQWLSDLLLLVKSSRKSMAMVSSMEDWQSCLFHLVSETIDELAVGETQADSNIAAERLDLCLEIYATLLGHLLREGGEKALDAVEHAASLQRICVNGQVVMLLIVSSLCTNLFDHGTLLEVGSLTAEDWKDIDLEHDSLLLKQSAKLVTDAILSNGTEGLDMNDAVRSWRSLRHLAEVVVALVSKSGLGVVDLFAYNKQRASAVDSMTGGMHGIRLSESRLQGISSKQYLDMLADLDGSFDKNSSISEDARRDIDRRLCVCVAAQVLTLLDAFIFPESLNTSLPASQIHGLALVRNSEPRLGAAQGPLIASAIKLSFLLMSSLEPCSVRMLQCVSRLRCLVQWALDLIRESQSSPPVAFEDRVAVLDRLLLAVILHCHRALGRCAALLSQLESSSSEKYFGTKDVQKKHFRRLVRVALELRSVVSTTYRGRNPVMKAALSSEAIEELRSSLEGSSAGARRSSSKEVAAKEFLNAAKDFLGSRWVTRFQDVEIRGDLSVPEQVTMDTIVLDGDGEAGPTGIVAIEKLAEESKTIQNDFEKAVDSSFGGYLESERKWTDTENVRDLECEGDATRKKMSDKQETDVVDVAVEASNRRIGADHRWTGIQRKAVSPWAEQNHFRVADFPDRLGRRTLLVQNRNFTSHIDAAYEGKGSSTPDSTASQKGGSDLTDLIRRNAEAFIVEQSQSMDDDSLVPSSDDSATDHESLQEVDSLASDDSGSVDPLEHENEDEWDKIDQEEIKHVDAHGDVDGWAKGFIWSENESVVARFDEVMMVSLQSTLEGKVLLTTHGLYFKGTGSEINIMTKEAIDNNDSSETKDRRWRLSRLTEIHGRRYLLRQQALELFFADCNELFLNFPRGGKERDRFHAKLRNSCKVPMLWSPKSLNPRIVFRKSRLTELWRKRKISNFEYLMALNRMAGRSFNDITQYPVFPWIISDYSSEEIDLNDSRVYRDLSKPIGALNPDRLAQLLERYKDLELFGFPEAERFLYGSHYSSPGIVLHLLIRQEPFTTMHIQLQSGRLDCPDRLFFDIGASWDGCMTSSSDMKELVPEFFSLPEVFLNTNKFPLGRMQSGRLVDNVGLPPWAKGSAHEFVRIQRQALESEYVSQNLHHWIDLIFGYKQRGEEAEAAHNIFHHLSYEGSVDLDKITDEVDRAAAESHIQNFGQTPSQLLPLHPHPERYFQEECWRPLIQSPQQSSQLRFYTPSRQFGNVNSEYAKGPILKVFALSDAVVTIYGDMSVGSYRWFPTYKSNRLRMDRLRPFARRELTTARDAMKRGSLVGRDQLAKSDYRLSSSSFALTIGGRLREDLRRNSIMPSSRLMTGTETTITSAEASSMIIGCGFWDEAIKVHSLETLRGLASETGGHRGPIHCIAVTFDGFMVSGGKDCTCRVWVVDHPDMAVAMSDGYVQTALGASQDGESILTCCHVLWGHETPVLSVDVMSDLDVVVSGSTNGLVCVHTMRRGDFIRSFYPPTIDGNNHGYNPVVKVALDSSGNVAVHMADHGLHLFTVNGVKLATVDAGEKLNDMKWNGEFLVTGGTNGKVVVRKLANLEACCQLDLSKHGPINSLALTPDELNPVGQYLFVGSDDGSISVVDENPNHSVLFP